MPSELLLHGSQLESRCFVLMKVVVCCRILLPSMEPLTKATNETETKIKWIVIEVNIIARKSCGCRRSPVLTWAWRDPHLGKRQSSSMRYLLPR